MNWIEFHKYYPLAYKHIDYKIIVNEKYLYKGMPSSIAYIKGGNGYAAMYILGSHDALEECIEGFDNTIGNNRPWKECGVYRQLNKIRNDRSYHRIKDI